MHAAEQLLAPRLRTAVGAAFGAEYADWDPQLRAATRPGLGDLQTALSVFYEGCPVLKADGDVRESRVALCRVTKRVLATGLDLLGITALERM